MILRFTITAALLVLALLWADARTFPVLCGPDASIEEAHSPFAPDSRSETFSDSLISISGRVSVIHPRGADSEAARLASEAAAWFEYLRGRLEKMPATLRIILAQKPSWQILSATPWGSVDSGADPSEAFAPSPGEPAPWQRAVLDAISWEKLSEAQNSVFRRAFDFSPGRGYYTIKRGIEESPVHGFDLVKAELFLEIAESNVGATRLSFLPDWAIRAAAIALILEYPDSEAPWLMKWKAVSSALASHSGAPKTWTRAGLPAFLRDFAKKGPLERMWFDGSMVTAFSRDGAFGGAEKLLAGFASACGKEKAVSTKTALGVIEGMGARLDAR